nr:hypothetical protein [Tanacetum cinerariifolium]
EKVEGEVNDDDESSDEEEGQVGKKEEDGRHSLVMVTSGQNVREEEGSRFSGETKVCDSFEEEETCKNMAAEEACKYMAAAKSSHDMSEPVSYYLTG